MLNVLNSVADVWIGRRAVPRGEALAAVSGRAPAVVVTGASRGIGRALAARFAADGQAVLLIAREMPALEEAASAISRDAGVRAVPLALDVTLPDAPSRIDAALAAADLYADVLVNNAGMGLAGPFVDQPWEGIEQLIALNMTAASRLMRHVLPSMLGRARGGILNVGSLGGLVPGPHQAAYYASKAYLISLTEAVAFETRGRGVRIAVAAPGPVDTGFHHAMRAEYALYRSALPALSADAVARSAYRGFKIGRRVIVPGLVPQAAQLAVKLLPHAITVPIVGALLGVTLRNGADEKG